MIQVLDFSGQRFIWQMDGFNGKDWGFDSVKGRLRMVPRPPRISNGDRHISLVQVRRNLISAYFDGQLIDKIQPQSSELTMPARWLLFGKRGLGLGVFNPTIFYSAQVTELGDSAATKSPGGPSSVK